MTRGGKHLWSRALLGGALLCSLALCSAADPEQEEPRTVALQEKLAAELWDEVVAEAAVLLEEDPGNAAVRAKLGLALLAKARSEEAVVDESRFEKVKDATDPAAFFDPALFETEVTLDDRLWQQARQEFDTVLEKAPENLDALVGLATIHAEADELEKEKELIRRAAAAHAGNREAGRRLLRFGEKYFSVGNYEAALDLFTILIEKFQDDATMRLDYGAAQFATGQYDAGAATIEKASAMEPADESIANSLAQMYLLRLRWEDAAAIYAEAEKRNPDDKLLTVQHAASWMPVDPDRARAILQEVVDADPDGKTEPGIIAGNLLRGMDSSQAETADLVYLSEEFGRLRMPHLGATVGGLILLQDPHSIAGRLVMSSIYDGLRYFDLSIEILGQATRILREHPEASAPFTQTDLVANFGRTYFRMGNYKKAIEIFESAEKPERFQFAMGLAYENQGDYENAFRVFSDVIQLGRPEQHVAQSRVHLNKDEYAPFKNAP